jgi:hypothetical protein
LFAGFSMLKVFSIHAVPVLPWSSSHPHNLRPGPLTLAFLCVGLSIFGLGEALMIGAGLGVSPWTVLAQGVSQVFAISIGWATFAVSVAVLLLWIPLRQLPGLGTLLNAIIIALAIELSLPFLPRPELVAWQLLQTLMGIFLVGLGSGMYLIAHLGAGPRDGLMTGLQGLSGMPIAWVRMGIEIVAVTSGWLLGGVVGLGTVLFALGIGPAVSLGLFLVESAAGSKPGKH